MNRQTDRKRHKKGKKLTILHIYPKEMNIYGDNGNIRVLIWRLKRYGYEPELKLAGVGSPLPKKTIDIIVGGGGQDSGQELVQADLQKKTEALRSMAEDGVVMLMVCGMYQLFGHYFKINKDLVLPGAGIFNAFTEASGHRLIGNVVAQSPFGRLVGFENHSGQTYLDEDQLPLAKIIKGHGNNEADNREGAVTNNVFGTYLHGPLLPKNPHFADELIRRALERRFGEVQLPQLDDTYASKAATIAAKRPQ